MLATLVDARLLTSYELEAKDGGARQQRVEVVHESLLKAWPRLVRWQAQDEDGAVLRDQLKQAAHLWDEKGRSSDLLWTGTAYQEFELWRERYDGGLTSREEDFARAMTQRARSRRRLQRLATVAVVASAVVVTTVTAALWRRSEGASAAARAQALRAEASTLVALGRSALGDFPTSALAYARSSLRLADTPEGRQLAIEALWQGGAARVLPLRDPSWRGAFSTDGRRLAAYTFSEFVEIHDADGVARRIGGFLRPGAPPTIGFSPAGDRVLGGWWTDARVGTPSAPRQMRIREVSLADGAERRWIDQLGGRALGDWATHPDGLLVFTGPESPVVWYALLPSEGGPARPLGSVRRPAAVAVAGDRLFMLRGQAVLSRPLAGDASTEEQRIGTVAHGHPMAVGVSRRGDVAVSVDDPQGSYLMLFPSSPGAGPPAGSLSRAASSSSPPRSIRAGGCSPGAPPRAAR